MTSGSLTRELRAFVRRTPAARTILWPALQAKYFFDERRGLRDRERRKRFSADFGKMLAEDPVLHVREFGGRFAIDARSDLFKRLLVDGEYEPRLAQRCIDLLDARRDAIDVGANVGFFSVLFATHLPLRRVLAIEPAPAAAQRLRRNLEMNRIADRVTVFEGVAAESAGSRNINVIEGKEEYSTIGAAMYPSAPASSAESHSVEAVTIDGLVSRHGMNPGLLKVDAEGSEPLIFDGARETLRTFRPAVLTEAADYLLSRNGSSARALANRFLEQRYRVLDPLTLQDASMEDFGEFLCLPEEHPLLEPKDA